jgi:hypothetical protein
MAYPQKVIVGGVRGTSFGDTARQAGSIGGVVIDPGMTEQEILDALAQGVTDLVVSPGGNAGIYPDAATGNAAVAEGDFFYALSGIAPYKVVTVYIKTGGVAVPQTTLVTRRDLSALNLDVGPGGDFAQLPAAFDYLREQAYPFGPRQATINLTTGFEMTENVYFHREDWSWIEITADDAVVPVDATLFASNVVADISQRYLIAGVESRLPVISALFDVQVTGGFTNVVGIGYDRSSGTISAGCGVLNAAGYGLISYNGGNVYAQGALFTGALNFAILCEGGSMLSAQSIDVSGSRGGMRLSQASTAHVANGNFNDQIGANGDGILTTQGCLLNAQISTANNCEQSGYRGRGRSQANLTGATSTGCLGSAIYGEKGFCVNAAQQGVGDPYFTASRGGGAAEPTILAKTGAQISIRGGDITGDLHAQGAGSFIDAPDLTGGLDYAFVDGFGAVAAIDGGHVDVSRSTVTCTAAAIPCAYANNGGKITGADSTFDHTAAAGPALKLDDTSEFKGKSAIFKGGLNSVSVQVDESSQFDAPAAQMKQNNTQACALTVGSRASIPNSTVIDPVGVVTNPVTLATSSFALAAGTAWNCNVADNTPGASGLIMR